MPAGEPSFWKLPAQIVVGLVAFVGVVLVGVVIVGAWGHRNDTAKLDRNTEQTICQSVIDGIEGLPPGLDATTRANLAANIAKQREISTQIASEYPEYETLTQALAGVHDRFAAGQPPGLDALIRECAVIGVPPR